MHLGLSLSPVAGQQAAGKPLPPGWPVFTAWPSLAPNPAVEGDSITVFEGTASGTPAPVLSYSLLLDGTDVTAQVSGGSYPGVTPGLLLLAVTATNSVGSAMAVAGARIEAAASGWQLASGPGEISILSAPAGLPAPGVSVSAQNIVMGAAS